MELVTKYGTNDANKESSEGGSISSSGFEPGGSKM